MIFWHEQAQMWWPEDDKDPATAYAWVKRHLPDVDEVTKRCSFRRSVVQAGGHVGMWPLRLAKSFDAVYTFEVQPSLQEALSKNCAKQSNIKVAKAGLGSHPASGVRLMRKNSAGNWRIDPAGDMFTNLVTIDDLHLVDCDAIVLDVEGYETYVLRGAARTIRECRPVIYLEELRDTKAEIQSYMARIGYRPVHRVHKDCVYVPAV